MRRQLLGAFGVAVVAVAANVEAATITLYDHSVGSGFTYAAGNGDTDGGIADLVDNAGLQVGQWVTAVAGGTTITEVQGDFLGFGGGANASAYVEVYDSSGSTLVATSGLVAVSYTNFIDSVFGLSGYTYTATGLNLSGLTAGTTYLVVMQVVGPYWFYLARDVNGVPSSFGRDFSHFGYPGGYGTTAWTEMGALGFGSGQANMRVLATSAVPEPATLLLLGSGLAVAARRRLRKRT